MSRTERSKVLEKQQRAVDMRRSGLSYDEIADRLGYANRSSAWHLVGNALREEVSESAQEYLELELERLDALLATHWPAAMSGDLAAGRLALRVIQAQANLLHLDRQTDAVMDGTLPIVGLFKQPGKQRGAK